MDLVQLSARNEADTAEMLQLIEERMSKGLSVQEKSGLLVHQFVALTGNSVGGNSGSSYAAVGTSSNNNLNSKCKLNTQRPKYGVVVNGQTLANCLLPANISNFLKIVERYII